MIDECSYYILILGGYLHFVSEADVLQPLNSIKQLLQAAQEADSKSWLV